jgi:hypothetical protein
VVLFGSIASLARSQGRHLRVTVDGDRSAFAAALVRAGYGVEPEPEGGLRVRPHDGEADADELFALASATGSRLTGVVEVRSSLEEIFLRTAGEAR